MQIYLSSWQWECCGEKFSVGSAVHWDLEQTDGIDSYLVSTLGQEWAGKITHSEDHHDLMQDGLEVTGVVRSIDVLTVDHDLVDRELVPVLHSGRLSPVGELDPWAPGLNHHPSGRMLAGWIVDLDLTHAPLARRALPFGSRNHGS